MGTLFRTGAELRRVVLGAKEPAAVCVPVLPPCVFAWPIAITGAVSHILSNGC